MLTTEKLKHFFTYDSELGLFYRKTKVRGSEIGDVAGYVEHTNGYIRIAIENKKYYAHRLAFLYMYGVMPDKEIDHINGIRTDNRFINLREATHSQNMMNTTFKVTNTSGYKGVYYDKSRDKYVASSTINYKKQQLGRFETAEQASDVYLEFAKDNYGEFYPDKYCTRFCSSSQFENEE